MAEPISTAIIVTGLASGAAGAFVKSFADNGVSWLIALVAAHSPEVQEQARQNLGNFVVRLAKRVETLESEIPADRKDIFDSALKHPSSSLMLQKVAVAASATDSEERHGLLAELIAQRLNAGADDMISLAGTAACDAVTSLSSRQIHILAVMAAILVVRPAEPVICKDQQVYEAVCADYWDRFFGPLVTPDLVKATRLDFDHLVALSCARISIGSKNLFALMTLKSNDDAFKVNESTFSKFGWWSDFNSFWNGSPQHCHLTSIGNLIGTLRRDAVLGSRTHINW